MGFLRRSQNLKKSSLYFWQERRVLCNSARNSILVKKSTKIFQNKCWQVVLYKLYESRAFLQFQYSSTLCIMILSTVHTIKNEYGLMQSLCFTGKNWANEGKSIVTPRKTLHYIKAAKLAATQPKNWLLFCLGNLFMTACLFFEYWLLGVDSNFDSHQRC